MKRTLKRLLAIILCLSLLFVNVAYADEDYQPTQEELLEMEKHSQELKDRYDALSQSLVVVQQQLAQAQSQKNQAITKRDAVKAEINVIQAQLDNLNEQMTLLNNNIEKQEIDMVNKQMEIEESQTKFEYRLVANQAAGATDFWSLIFSASSFSEFLTSLETIRQFAEYDTNLIKKLNKDKEDLEKIKVQLEKDKEDLQAVMAEADDKKAELDKKYKDLNGQVYSLNALAEQYASNKETIERGMADAQAEIDAFFINNILGGSYVGGEFMYPVPYTRNITSYYGPRTFDNGYSDYHTGIDFAASGCYGAAIVAANAGTVTFTKTTYVPGKGYGKYIIVDHGGGKSTLYGHCSSIAVKTGDIVSKGQTIGYIGSTGFSTGPHLHFEIRINGKHVNPLPYLTGGM